MQFMMGLEIHGTSWKKIADYIKTRTLVQVRTHAQKYFLRMARANQRLGAQSSTAAAMVIIRATADTSYTLELNFPRIAAPLQFSRTMQRKPGNYADNTQEMCRDGMDLQYSCPVAASSIPPGEDDPPHFTASPIDSLNPSCDNSIASRGWVKRESIGSLLRVAESLDWPDDDSETLEPLTVSDSSNHCGKEANRVLQF
jgi:hypothetical protein